MSYFSIDIETDGPIPGEYSMIKIGAVYVDPLRKLDNRFYANLKPISDKYCQETLDITKTTREKTLRYADPRKMMDLFKYWINQTNVTFHPVFISDNNGFDWMFVHWYFEKFLGLKQDPFGWSSRNLNDIYHGLAKDMCSSFKKLRKTKHTHNPVEDAIGNAEALLAMMDEYNLKIKL